MCQKLAIHHITLTKNNKAQNILVHPLLDPFGSHDHEDYFEMHVHI